MILILALIMTIFANNIGDEKVPEVFAASGQSFTRDTPVPGLDVIFFRHASVGFVWRGRVVYVDPLGDYADYALLPKADLILVTHEHYDHLDARAIEAASGPETVVVGSGSVARQFSAARAMAPGDSMRVDFADIQAVAAYNVSEHQLQFHPRDGGHNGYLITFGTAGGALDGDLGGPRIYVAGDTEPIPEMGSLGRVDIAFLPVNQPYTMLPRQLAEAAKIISPRILYPYHTGDTDLDQVKRAIAGVPSVELRIFPME